MKHERAFADVRDQYAEGYKDGQKAEREKCRSLLNRIAEIDGLIECTSLANWRDRVKTMAANFLKGK